MNEEIKKIVSLISSIECLSDVDKVEIEKTMKSINKELEVTAFKLDRTEKVKRTTSILLEETIEELEQKRKAVEKQAYEAKIEASLERVRLKAMAMNTSEELNEAVLAVFEGLDELGFKTIRCGIGIFNDDTKKVNAWTISPKDDSTVSLSGDEVLEGHPLLDGIYNAWSNQTDYSYKLTGKDLIKYYDLVGDSNLPVKPPENIKKELVQNYHCVMFPAGGLYAFSENDFSEEAIGLMKKFRDVFHLAFTRHLDLKKAEAQARKAKVEASLERLRSLTLGMRKSEDVGLVSDNFFSELTKLSVNVIGCSIVVIDESHDKMELWRARSNLGFTPFESTSFTKSMNLLKNNMPDWSSKFLAALNKKESHLIDELTKERRLKFIDLIAEQYKYSSIQKSKLLSNTPEKITAHYVFFKLGYLALLSENQLSSENLGITRRFVEVFDFAYTRFLDIKNAEAQARESQIEAALERVRAKTMAMHKSNELAQTAAHLFTQLNELGIKPYRCNIAIVNQQSDSVQLWSTTNSGNVIPTSTYIPLSENPVFIEMYNGWKAQKGNHLIQLEGEERLSWTNYISTYVSFKEYKASNIDKNKLLSEPAIFSNFYFKQGFFVIHTINEIEKGEFNIIQRFANVFEQTYTRFLDLENAEKQNKIIQAENERKTQELEEARQLQLAMLPKEIPQLPNLEIAVYMKTATEVGGDYYDFYVDPNNNLTAVIGDATGHGMKAGTMVTITKSLFNTLAASRDILKTFKRISQVIKNMKFRQLSMCLQMVKIRDDELSISSAAMPPAFIYNYNSESVDEILLSGMPLGALINYEYKIEKRKLNKGDVILLLSDGLPEQHNDKNEIYGYDRVKLNLKKVGKKAPQEIVDHLDKSAEEWMKNSEQDDDLTFVVIKVK